MYILFKKWQCHDVTSNLSAYMCKVRYLWSVVACRSLLVTFLYKLFLEYVLYDLDKFLTSPWIANETTSTLYNFIFHGQFMNFCSNEPFKNFFKQISIVSFALHVLDMNSSWNPVHEKCLISSCLRVHNKAMNSSLSFHEYSNKY